MTLTPEERAFLSECCATGAERKGRVWYAGNLTATRGEVGRLIRSGLLLRLGPRLGVSSVGRRAVAKGKSPPIGVEIQARGLRGRVIASGSNEATLLPTDGGKYHGGIPCVYEVHRPHSGAPWKGSCRPIGGYVGKPLWPALASLVPAIWSAPFATEPRTLARLREVNAKRAAVGGYGHSVEEQAAAAIVTSYLPLAGIRTMTERSDAYSAEVRAYLANVIRRDPAPFDAADFAYACERVKGSIFSDHYGAMAREPLTVRPLAEVAKMHTWLRPEMIQRAYACLVPWARQVVDDCEARIAASLARRKR